MLTIQERHRHRFEYNNAYRDSVRGCWLKNYGYQSSDTNLVEIVEIEDHPWFVGVQYHPEYKSTVANPHPLFVSLVAAALNYCNNQVRQFGAISTWARLLK